MISSQVAPSGNSGVQLHTHTHTQPCSFSSWINQETLRGDSSMGNPWYTTVQVTIKPQSARWNESWVLASIYLGQHDEKSKLNELFILMTGKSFLRSFKALPDLLFIPLDTPPPVHPPLLEGCTHRGTVHSAGMGKGHRRLPSSQHSHMVSGQHFSFRRCPWNTF